MGLSVKTEIDSSVEEIDQEESERRIRKFKMFYYGFIAFFGLFLLSTFYDSPDLMVTGAFVFFGIYSLYLRIIILEHEIFKRLP